MRVAISLLLTACAVALAGAGMEPISSAEVCGGCHRGIHQAWKVSAHALAMERRLFQDSLAMAETDLGPASKKMCLGCHAPLAVRLGDLALKQKVSWEGVTCDYCHSLRRVAPGKTNPEAVLEFSLVKSGPMKNAASPAHGAVFSEVHTSSLVCAPCHDYRNGPGLDVLATYTEWKNSRYGKESIWCQSCHMGRVAGTVVDPRVKAASDAAVNLHEMPGGHSLKQLTKAVQTRVRTERKDGRFNVSVDVMNSGAGHYVPTGSPTRQVVMELTADAYQGTDYREKRVYTRTVADAQGKALNQDHLVFVKGAKVLSDTRLAPDEKRTESFSFAIPDSVPVQLRVKLSYQYSPLAQADSELHVVFQDINRLVR